MARLIRPSISIGSVIALTGARTSIAPIAAGATRQFHSSRPARKNHANNPRWLSDVNQRLKRFQEPDVSSEKVQKAKELANHLQHRWLELLAGGEGFLTAKEWRGLDHHQVTWGDMDSMLHLVLNESAGHVNNVIYNKFAEAGRVNWLRNHAEIASPEHQQDWIDLMTPRGLGLILRSIKTDYKFPMDYPDRTTVLHKLISPPNYDSDHILLEAVIISERHQRAAARCFEDIVVFDYKAAKKAPLKRFMVDELRKTYEKQQLSRRKCEEEISNLVKAVDEIGGPNK